MVKKAKAISGTKEWSVVSVNCCTGCEHNCRYCYARWDAIHRYGGRVKSIEEWANPVIREKDVKKGRKKEAGRVMFPTTHDITPRNYDACATVLGKLLEAGNEVLVVSKPHRQCIRGLCEQFADYRKQILFRFTIGAMDDKLLGYWEPGAPSFKERFECLKLAFEHGFQTSVSVEPMLDAMHVVNLFRRLRPFITDTLWIGKMNELRQRVTIETDEDRRMVEMIEAGQVDEVIRDIYEALKDEHQIRWKESIKKVVGVPLAKKAGEDR